VVQAGVTVRIRSLAWEPFAGLSKPRLWSLWRYEYECSPKRECSSTEICDRDLAQHKIVTFL